MTYQSRETRARRAAKRRGLTVQKVRAAGGTRQSWARGRTPTYQLHDGTNYVHDGVLTLDELEAWLAEEAS